MADPIPPFRRRFTLSRPTPTTVAAELEDHIHHVAVTVEHHDGLVTAVDGRGIRLPWTLCPGAVPQLQDLVGRPVGTRPAGIDAASHCTHLLDCAEGAVRFAGTDVPARRVDLTVVDAEPGVSTATARRDDGVELVVQSDGRTILEPDPYRGRAIGAGFSRWAIEELDPDQSELALLLRRAIWMRLSVLIDLDEYEVLRQSGVPEGSCFASQPQRIDVARRNRGSSLVAGQRFS
jgi:hypothetical protein